MITILIKYKVYKIAPHAMLNNTEEIESKILEIDKLTDINNLGLRIVDVKILQENDIKKENPRFLKTKVDIAKLGEQPYIKKGTICEVSFYYENDNVQLKHYNYQHRIEHFTNLDDSDFYIKKSSSCFEEDILFES